MLRDHKGTPMGVKHLNRGRWLVLVPSDTTGEWEMLVGKERYCILLLQFVSITSDCLYMKKQLPEDSGIASMTVVIDVKKSCDVTVLGQYLSHEDAEKAALKRYGDFEHERMQAAQAPGRFDIILGN